MKTAQEYAHYFGLSYLEKIDVHSEKIPSSLLSLKLLNTFSILPLELDNNTLKVAISDPQHFHYLDQLSFETHYSIEPIFVDRHLLITSINTLLNPSLYSKPTEMNAVNLVNRLTQDAILQRASDIHLEPQQNDIRIRFRIDGLLKTQRTIEKSFHESLISRLKILSQLDITEKRLPQDGHFHFDSITKEIFDCRISTCPSLHGEKAVIRLLHPKHYEHSIDALGMTQEQQQQFLKALHQPQGLILVTGPTGGGKTVTLYAALNHINTETKNIITIEDPVEISLSHVNQVNIHPEIGFDFSDALKYFLRQDPDVIMVGEIRDLETAKMALRAAQTGHLVLATLHTNSAVDAIIRLINFGVEPFNIASSLNLVIAQRLVRKLSTEKIYHGRTGIFEILSIDETLRKMIFEGQSIQMIEETAIKNGMMTLKQSCQHKISQGITHQEELDRVLL